MTTRLCFSFFFEILCFSFFFLQAWASSLQLKRPGGHRQPTLIAPPPRANSLPRTLIYPGLERTALPPYATAARALLLGIADRSTALPLTQPPPAHCCWGSPAARPPSPLTQPPPACSSSTACGWADLARNSSICSP